MDWMSGTGHLELVSRLMWWLCNVDAEHPSGMQDDVPQDDLMGER